MSGAGRAQPDLEGRLARARAKLAERGVELLLVSAHVDLRYISGFTGSNGLALLDARERAPQRFLTDFRYTSRAEAEVSRAFERSTVSEDLLEAAVGLLGDGGGRLGFDEGQMTVREHRRLAQMLPAGWELVPCNGVVAELREVKDPGELELIRAACALADEALSGLLAEGIVGRTERELAVDLEQRMQRLGAQAASFPSIVAAGAHGAQPHAHPRELPVPPDALVTIDWGAVLDGYCSDCTRTYATGEGISALAREIYELVLAAQETGLAAVREGPTGREVDALARAVIEKAGHGEHFGHGLGHGVGMEVHEAPRLSRIAGKQALRAGNVVSVEPGVYLPDCLGVRIEDLVVVRSSGAEVLTSLPKALTVVA